VVALRVAALLVVPKSSINMESRMRSAVVKGTAILLTSSLLLLGSTQTVASFGTGMRHSTTANQRTRKRLLPTVFHFQGSNSNDDMVEVGSKEYLEGFISSPIQDDSVTERGSGLEQALKLGGAVAVGLFALFFGFMASNGLL
jgi:hypothetical protein